MILCGCDSIIDSGFLLRQVDEAEDPTTADVTCTIGTEPFSYNRGRRFEFEEFDKLEHCGVYILEKATERNDLKKVTGDRLRRYTVKIPPLQHVEVQKALQVMQKGSNLLRQTGEGLPHLRLFQLSSDRRRLLLYSADVAEQFSLPINAIREVVVGQKTPLFTKFRIQMLEHLSFSLLFDASKIRANIFSRVLTQLESGFGNVARGGLSSLDLTCKDAQEFDLWVTGLKALLCAAHDMVISKLELLGHSYTFQVHLSELTGNPPPIRAKETDFESCLNLPVHTLAELEEKLVRITGAAENARSKLLDFESTYQMSYDTAMAELDRIAADTDPVKWSEAQQEPGSGVFMDRSEEEDDLLEYVRMRELVLNVEPGPLEKAKSEIYSFKMENPTMLNVKDRLTAPQMQQLRNICQTLWKAEIDVENAADMLSRLLDRRNRSNKVIKKIIKKFDSLGGEVKEELQKIQSAFNILFNNSNN